MQWPIGRKRFGLQELAEISGAGVASIQRWQHREALKVRAVGRGKVRTYGLSDALHVAVIAEMATVGLTITGNGAMLSSAIVGYVELHFRGGGGLHSLGALALIPVRGEDDWEMEPRLDKAIAGSCIVLGLNLIVEGVLRRYNAI